MQPEAFIELCNRADVITVDNSPYLHSVDTDDSDLTSPESEVMRANWHDADGLEFEDKFTVQGVLESTRMQDGSLSLNNYEGEPTVIRFFTLTPITD